MIASTISLVQRRSTVAKKKPPRPGATNGGQPGDPAPKESIAGYFRGLFEENPRLLNERSNEPLLSRWRQDHPGENVSASVKAGLANIKSVLRSKRRKKAARKVAADEGTNQTLAAAGTRRVPRPRGLASLEEALDDCLMMAKATDREGLQIVIDLLRRARNQVVWKLGEPE
jgi:hypothetical protein